MQEQIQLPVLYVIQMLGPSLLSLPYIIHDIGYAQAIIQIAVCISIVCLSFHYIVEASHYTMAHSYRELIEKLTSRRLALGVQAFIYLFDVGLCTGLMYVSADAIVVFV